MKIKVAQIIIEHMRTHYKNITQAHNYMGAHGHMSFGGHGLGHMRGDQNPSEATHG